MSLSELNPHLRQASDYPDMTLIILTISIMPIAIRVNIILRLYYHRHPVVAPEIRLMEEPDQWRKEDLTSCPELQPSTSNYVSNFRRQQH